MKLTSFFSSTSALIFGLGLYSFFNFLVIFFIGKEYGLVELGKYSLALSIITPLYIFIFQSYRTYIVTYENIKYSQYDFYSSRIILSSIFIIPILLLSLYINNYFLIIIFFVKFIEGLSDISYSFYNKNKKIYFIGYSTAIKSFIALFLMYFCINFFSLYCCFLILIIFYFLFFIFYDSNISFFTQTLKKIKDLKGNFKNIYEIYGRMKFMIYSALIAGLVYHIPKYYLGAISSEELGVFTIVTSLSVGINLVAISMGQVIQPYVKEMNLNKILIIIFLMILILLVVLMALFFLVSKFYNYVFIDYLKLNFTLKDFLLCNLLFLSIYIGQILSFVASSYKKYRGIFFINFFSVIFLIIFSGIFINYFGGVFGGCLLFMCVGLIQILGYSIIIYKNSGVALELS